MEKNVLSEPKITKITVNMGVGRLKDDKNFIASAKGDLALITGQAPCERRAKKSIAGFKRFPLPCFSSGIFQRYCNRQTCRKGIQSRIKTFIYFDDCSVLSFINFKLFLRWLRKKSL